MFDQAGIDGRLLILGQPGAGKTTMLLELAQKLATVKHGILDWSNKGDFPPTLTLHWWIDVEPYRIDYRGRIWYEFNPNHHPLIEQVPYGVFIPADFPFVSYQFERIEEITPVR